MCREVSLLLRQGSATFMMMYRLNTTMQCPKKIISLQALLQQHHRTGLKISWQQAVGICLLAFLLFSAVHGALTMRKRKPEALRHQAHMSDFGVHSFHSNPIWAHVDN